MILPKPTKGWDEEEIKAMYDDCQCAMKSVDNYSFRSEQYMKCLQIGREAVTEKMMEFIMNTAYFKEQCNSSKYVLYWRDAPQAIAMFVQHLETVFTGNEDLKIRKKESGTNAAAKEVAPASPPSETNAEATETKAAATEVPLSSPPSEWNEDDIKLISGDCLNAMNALVENPAIISQEYKQCLQRGRNAIIEAIKELITNTSYFRKQYKASSYVLYWRDAPKVLVSFLKRIESVFTDGKEFKITIPAKL